LKIDFYNYIDINNLKELAKANKLNSEVQKMSAKKSENLDRSPSQDERFLKFITGHNFKEKSKSWWLNFKSTLNPIHH